MLQLPLQATPSQQVKVVLDQQNFKLLVYQKNEGLFVDVNVDGEDIVLAVIARDLVPVICREYLGVRGNLVFVDTQGADDPVYTGLGARFQLLYLTEAEYALVQG